LAICGALGIGSRGVAPAAQRGGSARRSERGTLGLRRARL